MTNDTTHDIDTHDADAKLASQHRRQLSALVDGDLSPDQARFLLRRLEHDEDLSGRWQRWHLIGDVLRGNVVAALPAGAEGFAASVAASVAREGTRSATGWRPRWQHGVGLAAAASVAALALFVTRPVSVDSELPGAVATVEAPAAPPTAEPGPLPAERVREASVPQFAVATTVPEPVPARPGTAATGPEPSPPATLPAEPVEAAPPVTAVASVAMGDPADAPAGTGVRPFASPAEPQARPWPRATLPGIADSRFTVGFGDTVDAPSFYPFEPQLPERAAEPERTP